MGQELPKTRGTWTGYAEPTSVYDKQGSVYRAMSLRIIEGPEMPKARGWRNEEAIREYEKSLPPRYPLLVAENGNVLPLPDINQGEKIRVRGMMTGFTIRGPENQAVSRTQPVQAEFAWAIRASKVWKAPAED